MPPVGMVFFENEAAAYYGKDIVEFRRLPRIRRAEMIAHLMIKGTRAEYIMEKQKEAAKGGDGKLGYDPMATQKRAWMI